MKRNTTITVIIVVVLLGIAGFAYFRQHYFPRYRWHADYKKNSAQPYGFSFLYKALKEREHSTVLVYNNAYWNLDSSATTSNFIYAGPYFTDDSASVTWLLSFVERGNRALIASDEAPLELLSRFLPAGDSIHGYHAFRTRAATISFEGDGIRYPEPLHFNYQQLKDTAAEYSWTGYSKAYMTDTLKGVFTPLAAINNTLVTAFAADHGKGRVVVHANPVTLTNYHFVRAAGYRHAANLLANLHNGTTYWDDPSSSASSIKPARKNPLKFLFSHPHLLWAWYLFIATVLLYILFRSKREQRIIPLMPANVNSALGHVRTVGTLYFRQGGQRQVAAELHTLFLADLRARYRLVTDIPEDALAAQVVRRSGVSPHLVNDLFRQFSYVRKSERVSGDDVINLYHIIEKFNQRKK